MSYRTIVVDPPWQVTAGRSIGRYEVVEGKQLFGVTSNRARELAYPSLSVEEISRLPVTKWADEAAHLYLWCINRYVPDAYRICHSWGFNPSTLLVWSKRPMGGGLGGDAFGLSTEFCLFARRGVLRAKKRINTSWFTWKRPYHNGYPKHSAKPPEFMEMVEQVSHGPYLEVFARSRRDGWDTYGNEVESTIEVINA